MHGIHSFTVSQVEPRVLYLREQQPVNFSPQLFHLEESNILLRQLRPVMECFLYSKSHLQALLHLSEPQRMNE